MIARLIESALFSSLIFLAIMLLSNPLKVNRRANMWLGLTTLLWASFWLDEIILITSGQAIESDSFFILQFFRFLTPLTFFLSVTFFTNPNYRFTYKRIILSLLIPLVYALVLFLDQHQKNDLSAIQLGLQIVYLTLFTTASFLRIRQHQKNILLFSSDTLNIDLKWLKKFIIAILIISLIISFFNLIFYKYPLNIYINFIMLCMVYYIAYHAFRQKEIFPQNEGHRQQVIAINDEEEVPSSTKKKLLSDEQLSTFKVELNQLMAEQEPYLDSHINLTSLADLLSITPHQLSYLINNGYNENFFQFINKYRVEKAKTILEDEAESNKLSILGIAFEAGFNSKTSFNTTFKKLTGLTPSEYQKEHSA